MADIDYREGFAARDFLALAQRVWPRAYELEAAAAALTRTVNLGAWSQGTLVGSVRLLTDGYFYATIPEILVAPEYCAASSRSRRGARSHSPPSRRARGSFSASGANSASRASSLPIRCARRSRERAIERGAAADKAITQEVSPGRAAYRPRPSARALGARPCS